MARRLTETIAPAILAVLSSCTVDGHVIRITAGQLARPLYEAVNEVLVNLGGKWDRRQRGHVFATDPRARLDEVLTTGTYLSLDRAGYFPTPPALAELMVDLLRVKPGMTVLEPSAGQGALADAVAPIVGRECLCLVERLPNNCRVLRERGYDPIEDDFLARDPMLADPFDRIVMNPPFAGQQDITHVLHAWDFLKPGGRLVAIMSAGVTFRQDTKSRDFRAFVDHHGTVAHNARDAFKESGTQVHSIHVVLDK